MTQDAIASGGYVPYATPAVRVTRLAPAVWLSIIGLMLIFFGGCFLIGVMLVLIPQMSFGPSAQPVKMTPGILTFLVVLYAAAFLCFGGALILVGKGVKRLFAMVRE